MHSDFSLSTSIRNIYSLHVIQQSIVFIFIFKGVWWERAWWEGFSPNWPEHCHRRNRCDYLACTYSRTLSSNNSFRQQRDFLLQLQLLPGGVLPWSGRRSHSNSDHVGCSTSRLCFGRHVGWLYGQEVWCQRENMACLDNNGKKPYEAEREESLWETCSISSFPTSDSMLTFTTII